MSDTTYSIMQQVTEMVEGYTFEQSYHITMAKREGIDYKKLMNKSLSPEAMFQIRMSLLAGLTNINGTDESSIMLDRIHQLFQEKYT